MFESQIVHAIAPCSGRGAVLISVPFACTRQQGACGTQAGSSGVREAAVSGPAALCSTTAANTTNNPAAEPNTVSITVVQTFEAHTDLCERYNAFVQRANKPGTFGRSSRSNRETAGLPRPPTLAFDQG